MKYLVAAEDTTLEDNVSSHFGKAPYFIIYDTDKDSFETITNGENVDPHLVIRNSAKAGAKKLICGNIGPNAYLIAEKHKVTVYISPAIKVRQAIELASNDQLPIAQGPTMQHGMHHHDHHDHSHN